MTTRYFVTATGTYIGGFDVPADALTAMLPAGAVEVPSPPANAAQTWDGQGWRRSDLIPVKVAAIKAEAFDRITAIVPTWKQNNLLAQATLLLHKGPANWTAEDQAAWDTGEALWNRVSAIRAASDAMEAEVEASGGGDPTTSWP